MYNHPQYPNNHFHDEAPSHHWRTEIPNIIETVLNDPYEFRVYMHIKRRAGDGGSCFESNKSMAESCGMSERKLQYVKKSLSEPRKELQNRPLIRTQKRKGDKGNDETDLITIVNMWDINMSYFNKNKMSPAHGAEGGARGAPGGVHDMQGGGAQDAPKEEPLEEEPIKESNARSGKADSKPVDIQFDISDQKFTGISEKDKQSWSVAYPLVDLVQQLTKAAQWVLANPSKTKKLWRKFLINWFDKEQTRLENQKAYRQSSADPKRSEATSTDQKVYRWEDEKVQQNRKWAEMRVEKAGVKGSIRFKDHKVAVNVAGIWEEYHYADASFCQQFNNALSKFE